MNNNEIIISKCEQEQLLLYLKENNENIHVTLKENSYLNLGLINFTKGQKNKIQIDVFKNSAIEIYLADFSLGHTNLEININLKEEKAKSTLKLATLSRNDDQKKFDVYFNHLAPLTYGEMDNYGVARHQSKIVFGGANEIIKGSVNSATHQTAKIIVFDQKASGIAHPSLNIYENEVKASHAAVVGKLSEEHLFYLMSRGLNEEEAKKLITYGYLMPIAQHFTQIDLKVQITKSIEEQ